MHPRRRRFLVPVVAAVTILAGCGEDETGLDLHSDPPTTEIISPILSGQAVGYALEVRWRGSDRDGALHGFEIAIDDTAAWTFTPEFDSVFAFESPACCVPDTVVLPDSTVVIDSVAYGMHTLFVRAVDNGGEVDPTPARISFNATTITPETRIIRGVSAGVAEVAPQSVAFAWEADDVDGGIAGYRYRLDDKPWASVGPDCTHVGFVGLSPAEFMGDPAGLHKFTVLAIDNAGATERSLDTSDNFREWYALEGLSWSRLCISSNVLPTRCEPNDAPGNVVNARLNFTWEGDASRYGGEVVCYSYSYDGSEFSPCSAGLTRFPPDAPDFSPRGNHILTVRARDDLGQEFELSYPFFAFDYHFPPEPGQILYIDDFALGTGTDGVLYPQDPMEEAFWDTLLTGFPSTKFDAEAGDDVPSRRILGTASTVIWNIDDESQLKAEIMRSPAFRDTLRSAILSGQNLILCGSIPTSALVMDNFFDPVTVQNPGCPHEPRLTYGGADRSLHWFPAFCDTGQHFVYDVLGLEKSYYDGSRDDLRALMSGGWPLPDGLGPLPDLVIDTGKRGVRDDGMPIFDVLGLEQCEQYDLRAGLSPIPLWRFRDDDGELKRVCACYLPKAGTRGHVVVLGFSPYFFDTEEMQEVFRRLLIMFGENYNSP